MTEREPSADTPKQFDITKAGALTLHQHGISFAVDGAGQVLRGSDGTPIDGKLIEDRVNQSGRILTNAEAAGQLIASQEFADRAGDRIAELRSPVPATEENVDPNL